LNGALDSFPETNGDLWNIRGKEVIAELTYDSSLAVCRYRTFTNAGRSYARQERVRALADGTPKLIFRELLGGKSFSEQCVEFFRCSR